MARHILWFVCSLALSSGLVGAPAQAQGPAETTNAPSGPVPGETVWRNEGWYRVEPRGTPQEGFVGALEVGPSPWQTQAAPSQARRERGMEEGPTLPVQKSQAPPCKQEQAKYLQELFRIAGIWYFPEALDLVEALGANPGIETQSPWLRFNLFGLTGAGAWAGSVVGVDPIRPLGWDEGLRWAAKDLVACWSQGR